MGMDLGVKTYSTKPEYFEAGTYPVAKAVKTAVANIPAHAPVVLDSSGKLAPVSVTKGGTDEAPTYTVETTGLYGVVPDSIEKDAEGIVYLTGEFFADSLTLPEGASAAAVETALRGLGIFLK